MTGQELNASIAETDSQLSAEDLAIKQQVEADTNVFSGTPTNDLSEPEFPLSEEQQANVNSTKLVPDAEEEGYKVSETFKPTTPYGEMAKAEGVEAADNFYAPISAQAIKDGYTEEEVEAKIGVQKYHKDATVIDEQNKAEVDTIVASNSEYNSSFTQMAQDLTDEERVKYNTQATITQLEKSGFVLDPKTGEMTKDGQSYDLKGSFAKTMEAHQAQVMFGILGGGTGALAGPYGAAAGGAMGVYVGEIVDNIKLKGVKDEGNESVLDEPKTVGDVASSVLKANSQAAIVATEDLLVGKALQSVFSAVGTGWRYFSTPTKNLVQDIKAGNINTAFDKVVNATTKSVDEVVDETIDLLSVTEGGDAMIQEIGEVILKKNADNVPLTPADIASLPSDFKRALVNKELMTNPDLKATLNNVLSDPDAIAQMSVLIRQHTDSLNSHFSGAGLDSVIVDPSKGITFKQGLDKALSNTLDILDMSAANLASATKHNKLNPDGISNLQDSIIASMNYLKPEIQASLNMVGADTRTMRLSDKVIEKANLITDMSSLLDFRKSYNELLRQLKVYDNVPYDKTMRGSKTTATPKVDKNVALQLKEDIDALIKQTVEESPMTAEDKKAVIKNWDDSNKLAQTVYETRATDLYKAISKPSNGSSQIADMILKSIGKQGGDFASIMAHLTPEQAVKFEENLIMRSIELSTSKTSELIDYRALSKRLKGLADNTANESTRNAIEVVETYTRLFGSDADIYKSLTQMQEPGGLSRGLQVTFQGVLRYTGIGLAKHFAQMNYLAGKRFVGDVAPIIGNTVDKIPLAGKYLNRLDKSITDYATSEAMKSASLQALKKAGSVQEFNSIAKEMTDMPVKLRSAINESAEALTKAQEEAGLSINQRNAEVDIWIQKKQEADDLAFAESEARQAKEDAFVKENTPSTIQSAEARATDKAEKAKRTQVAEPNTVSETIATARAEAEGAGHVPDSNRIPSQLETDVVTVDGSGNPVSNAGDSAGWGANRNVTVQERTATQDIKDSYLNGGMKDPEFAADIVEPQKQLPPSKTIVTPQTSNAAVDARLKRARDMTPKEAYDLQSTQGKIADTTTQSRQVEANNEWADTMSGNDGIASDGYYNNYDDYLHAGTTQEAQSIAPEAVVKMKANGIEMNDKVKNILDTGAMEKKVGPKQRLVSKNKHQGNLDVDTNAVESSLTPKMVERIRAGKGTKADYERLQADIDLYEAQWGTTTQDTSATSQMDSFMTGGIK